jgi:putative transposase
MTRKLSLFILRFFSITVGFLEESLRFGRRLFRPKVSQIAENLFFRKQLAFYQEHNVRPQRLTDSARLWLLLWSRWFDWRNALVVVKPETLIAWHRRAFQLFWRWKCRELGGRPRLP